MAGHFVRLLEGIVADPECRIDELPLLTAAERHRLLVEWNDTAADYPQDRCIHELFEQQAARHPDAVAVVFEDAATHLRRARRARQSAGAPPAHRSEWGRTCSSVSASSAPSTWSSGSSGSSRQAARTFRSTLAIRKSGCVSY